MSKRLTSISRSRILRKLLDHRFGEEEKLLKERSIAIAHSIYNTAFSEDDRALMNSLPEGWLRTGSHIQATIGGKYESHCMGGDFLLPECKFHQCVGVYDGGHPIEEAWLKLKGDQKDFKAKKNQAEVAASAILESVTMTGALITRWPEIAGLLVEEDVIVQLPTLPIDEVNRLLDLPPKKVAA